MIYDFKFISVVIYLKMILSHVFGGFFSDIHSDENFPSYACVQVVSDELVELSHVALDSGTKSESRK